MHKALAVPLEVTDAHTGLPATATHEAFLIVGAGWGDHEISIVRVIGKVNGLGHFQLIHVPDEEEVLRIPCDHAELNTVRDELARILALAG